MDRRAWLVNMMAGLCAGALAGCNTFSAAPSDSPTTASRSWWKPPPEQPPSTAVAAAAQTPAKVVKRPQAPVNKDIERVSDASQTAAGYPLPEVNWPEQPQKTVRQSPRTVPAELTAQPEVRAKQALEPPLLSALRCFMDKRPAQAIDYLRGYDKSSQDLLLCMLPLMARLTEGGMQRVDAQEATALVTQLRRMDDVVAPQANLVIGKMCFVRLIQKFGVYQAWGEDHLFRPNERMLIYAEVQNFSNLRVEQSGSYEVRLSINLEIRDYQNKVVEITSFLRMDQSHCPRRDYYNWYGLNVPECPPGMYALKLTVKDVPTGRTATRSLDFQVGPPSTGPAHGG